MKKIITILGVIALFILIITSCNNTKKSKTSEGTTNKSDSNFVDKTLDEFNFNQKAFDIILRQLNLQRGECHLPFVSSQILPLNKSLTIWVIPKVTSGEEDTSGNEILTLDGYILLADTKTGEIKSKFYNPNTWESDAWELSAIGIDTLGYRLNDNRIMFGIYSTHQGSSKVFPAGENFHQLFVQDGDSLKCIFDYVANQYQGENDGNTSGKFTEYTTDVVVTHHKTNAFYDFALITDSRTEERQNDEIVNSLYSTRDSIRLFSFTGEKYEEVKQNDSAIVYTEQSGESYKQYWFYYGKSLEQTYNVFMNSQEGKGFYASFLKKEMPKENLEYEVESDDLGEISVTYEYNGSKYLVINAEYEIGNNYIEITEKAEYTRILAWSTD